MKNAKFLYCLPLTLLIAACGENPQDVGSCESFDWGWKFAKFGKHADCLAKAEPGVAISPATASSAEDHNPAKNAVDGDLTTRWCAAGAGTANLTFDLGKICDIAQSSIVWEEAADYGYAIEASSDGKTWEKVADKTNAKIAEKNSKDNFKISARFLKLSINPAQRRHWPSVYEWTLFDATGEKIVPVIETDGNAFAYEVAFDDSAWRSLDLPHDWGVESEFLSSEPNQTGSLPWNAVGWYRKEFTVPAEKQGKQFYLNFDGVMMMPKIYVNGKLAGEWKYGYSSFQIDITPFLKFGEKNIVAVRAENLPNSTRWYPGAGIYRHTYLVEKSPTHIGYNGVWVKTPEITTIESRNGKRFAGTAKIEVATEIETHGNDKNYSVENVISKDGNELARFAGTQFTLKNVELWDIENPALYTLTTLVRDGNGKLVDEQKTEFGIRKSEWKSDGFYLNDRRVQIKGVCQHHDLGPLGGAIHKRAIERQIEILQSFGVNAIRTSHNPPAPEFLALCDKMGVLVNAELFDCWKYLKEGKINGYNLFWNDWRERDVRNFVKRDRNHPSIICWSVGNEIEEQGAHDGAEIARDLVQRFKKYDPTRPTTVGSNDIRASKTEFGKQFDIFGFNYKPNNYNEFAKANPNMPFFGSETSSCVSSRGYFMFPRNDDYSHFWNRNFCDNNLEFHVGDYSIYSPGWAYSPDVEFGAQEDAPRSAGEFVWTGFDYLGEPTPWNLGRRPANDFRGASPEEIAKLEAEFKKIQAQGARSRSSYFGIVDLCGFWKERTYLYQSQWMPNVPMAHILPHWNWVGKREGKITPVMVYTSGDEAELFLNGKSLGKRKKNAGTPLTGKDLRGDMQERFRLVWRDVKFEAGTLEVVAYKNGKEWARDKVETTGVPAKAIASVDRTTIAADGRDLAYVTIRIQDAQDRNVPDANNMLHFKVEGDAAEIVGVCNGDPTDHLSMKGDKMPAFSGMAQVILRSRRGVAGTAILKIEGENITGTTVEIKTK